MGKNSSAKLSITTSVLVLILVSFSKVSCGSNSPQTEVSILGSLQSTQQINVGKLRTLFTVDEKIFTNVVNADDSTNILRVYDASTLEELWHVEDSWFVYRGCEGNNPCIVMRKWVGEGRAKFRIYDIDGNLLFTKEKFEGTLFSSPNCEYIYSDFSPADHNQFKIFDRRGVDFSPNFKTSGVWSAYAFNDSVIVLSSPSEITFVSTKNSTILERIPSPDGQIGIDPIVDIPPNGDMAIINWYLTTLFVNSNFEVLWKRTDTLGLFDCAISSDGKLVACLFGKYDRVFNSGMKMKLMLIESQTGKELYISEFTHPAASGPYRNLGMKFVKNILYLTIPYSSLIDVSNLDPHTQTRIYIFNSNTGIIDKVEIQNGLVEVISLDGIIMSSQFIPESNGLLQVSRWEIGKALQEKK